MRTRAGAAHLLGMDITSESTEAPLEDTAPPSSFGQLHVGDPVYVDEGDSFGCQEYSGVVDSFTADGQIKVRTAGGHLRVAQRHQVDPA